MYVMLGTRPDIAFFVGFLDRYASKPMSHHFQMACRVVCYLVGINHLSIHYKCGERELKLTEYVDSNWKKSKPDHRSTTSYVFLINGMSVS